MPKRRSRRQVTPGGLGRTGGDGTPYWCHYLQATLGGVTLESDVSPSHTRPRAHTCTHWSPVSLAPPLSAFGLCLQPPPHSFNFPYSYIQAIAYDIA
jgi:hypothetical protein